MFNMFLDKHLNQKCGKSIRITVAMTLLSMLAVGVFSISSHMVSAIDINELTNIRNLSGLGLDNDCIAFDFGNIQTIEENTTFSNNPNPSC